MICTTFCVFICDSGFFDFYMHAMFHAVRNIAGFLYKNPF